MTGIFILGMHRSGTSALSGCVQHGGAFLGDVVTYGPFNRKGSRENRQIAQLNEAVLRANGGSWFDPPQDVKWTEAQMRERDAILASYVAEPLWAIKDPRLLLTFEGWRSAVDQVSLVGSFRHPSAVVRSLRQRTHRLGDDESLFSLWLAYNQKLIALWEKDPFPVVNFGAPEGVYRQAVGEALARLGLDPTRGLAFFDPELRTDEALTLPDRSDVTDVYATLQRIAI